MALSSVQDRVRELVSGLQPFLKHATPWVEQLKPWLATVQQEALRLGEPVWRQAEPTLQQWAEKVDNGLVAYRPWQIALLAVLGSVLVAQILSILLSTLRSVREIGLLPLFFNTVKSLPVISSIVRREQRKIEEKMRAGLKPTYAPGDEPLRQLPKQGMAAADLRMKLETKEKNDVRIAQGHSLVSGAVYFPDDSHMQLINHAYTLFAHTNPLHGDVFPSVRRMEAEVVAMCASMLGGGPNGDPEVCGVMTSGGTESILSAVKASRDYMRATRGVRAPEMIIAESAHAAYFKAAEYFKIKLVMVRVGRDYRLSGDAVRRALGRDTVLVVASAPGYPHGLMDHVEDIAKETVRRGVPLHVDACLGGFVLPFARKLGYPVPPFDFGVAGVTSMSIDTHKFGMAHKGTSVVLYRHRQLRQHQYTSITEWSGGLYISPGFAGSRSGALIASAWAALVHLGEEGYLDITAKIMAAAKEFEAGVHKMEELEVIGSPEMCNIAFKAVGRGLDVYKVNDLMGRRGWHLSALQHPAALHMCFTAQHLDVVPDLLKDLEACVKAVKEDPKSIKDGMAPLYGMAAVIPDRSIVGQFLVAYQDALLTT